MPELFSQKNIFNFKRLAECRSLTNAGIGCEMSGISRFAIIMARITATQTKKLGVRRRVNREGKQGF